MKKPLRQHIAENATKKRLLIAAGLVLLVIAAVISVGFWLYSSPATSAKINLFEKFNLPVAKVGSGYIGGKELFQRADIASQLYGASNSNFDISQSQSDILDKLIADKKLGYIAAFRKVNVTTQEINTEYDREAASIGGPEKFAKMLSDKYHFSPDDYKTKALYPDLLKTKLAINFYEDKSLNPQLYQTLGTVEDKLSAGGDFANLAKTYSEDSSTSQFGGDSGVIPFADLAPEFQDGLKDKQNGDVATVATRFGIYVIKVINRKDDGKGGGSIHFQSIFLNYGKIDSKVTESAFSKWFDAQSSSISAKKYINL